MRPTAALARASTRLDEAGVASPATDARALLMHATGFTATELLVAAEVDEASVARFDELVERRCRGVPLQHLTGRVWFRNIELAVGPGVFIPRPETELVAQAVIDEARRLASPLVVELCAGSGAISAAVRDEVPGVRLVAVEREPEAAIWLRRNLPAEAEVIEADMAAPLPHLESHVDVVVANPPYIPWSQSHTLPAEVRDHDPQAALFAEDDGMGAIRVVISVAQRLLRPGGLVVIEHGDDQAPAVLAELEQAGFGLVCAHRDLTGRTRFATGRSMPRWDGERAVQS